MANRRRGIAIRAFVRGRHTDAKLAVSQPSAMAAPKLGEGSADLARQPRFAGADGWRTGAKDAVRRIGGNSFADYLGVDEVFNRWEGTTHQDSISQVRLHQMADFLAERGFHLTRAWRQEDGFMGDVAWFKGPGEKLGSEKQLVRLNWKYQSFCVQMFDRRELVSTGDETQRAILNELKPVKGSLRVERKYDRGRIVEERTEDSLIGGGQAFLVTPEG